MAWHRVASVGEVPPGEAKGVTVGAQQIAIYNVDGSFYATDNVCTHAFAILSDGYLEGRRIECPMHQGIFDVCTGKALEGPVSEDLRTFPVKVEDGAISVEV